MEYYYYTIIQTIIKEVTIMKNYQLHGMAQIEADLAKIDAEFENIVASHIIGNYLSNPVFPPFLAIHGPKGEGKSFQTLRTCAKYGFKAYYISGAELSGAYEGDSITNIEKNLDDAFIEYNKNHVFSVFVIDDFHLSIASTDIGVSKTVNSQLLIGWLMNQADRARIERRYRIPFILLGNDYSNLYAPLTRDGRMDFYEWKPSSETKMKIIKSHFEDFFPEDRNGSFEKLIEEYIDEPISFFAELKKDLLKQRVRDELRRIGVLPHEVLIHTLEQINTDQLCDPNDIIFELKQLAKDRKGQSNRKETIHEERK